MKYMVTYSYYSASGQKVYHCDIFEGIEKVMEVLSSIKSAIDYELVSVTLVEKQPQTAGEREK